MSAPQPSSGKPATQDSVGDFVSDSVSDVVRWAAFSCALVPVVLVAYGTSLAGAAGTALGLAAGTGVCRALLKRSARFAASTVSEKPAEKRTASRRRHARESTGAHRGGRRASGRAPVG